MRIRILALIAAGFWAASASAQSTTGTISGRVVDPQGLAVPGVTVTAASPNLQGVVTTVTSENGDEILALWQCNDKLSRSCTVLGTALRLV